MYEELMVIMPASSIPDGAEVSKVKGQVRYVLRHNLKIYLDDKGSRSPQIVEGYFLVGGRGQINQVKETALLCWYVTLEELVADLGFGLYEIEGD